MIDQIGNWTLLNWLAAAGVLAGIIAALYAILAYYRKKESPKPGVRVTAKNESIAAGRDVNIGSPPKRKGKKK